MFDTLTDAIESGESANRPNTSSRDTALGDRRLRVAANVRPDWLHGASAALTSLLRLRDGWDSYGAAAPRRVVVESANGLLCFLADEGIARPTRISATASGGVFLQWAVDGHELEIDVVSRDAASYVYEDLNSGQMVVGGIFSDDADDGRFLALMFEHFSE